MLGDLNREGDLTCRCRAATRERQWLRADHLEFGDAGRQPLVVGSSALKLRASRFVRALPTWLAEGRYFPRPPVWRSSPSSRILDLERCLVVDVDAGLFAHRVGYQHSLCAAFMLKAFTFSGFRPSLDRCVVRLLFFACSTGSGEASCAFLEKKDDPMRGGMRGVIRMERFGLLSACWR